MNERTTQRILPPLQGLIAGGLVILGVLLWMFVSKGLLIVAALGAFGPGVLREFGWLRDKDEFQRQAARRAGYHAYLISGIAMLVFISLLAWVDLKPGEAAEWVTLVLVVSWLSWMFSSLFSYWGASKTVSRLLVAVGLFWAVFAIASAVGESGNEYNLAEALLGLLVGIGLVAPFFILAWTARRWPRPTGVALLVVAVLFVMVFGIGGGNFALSTVLLKDLLLIAPVVASGIALLRYRTDPDEALDA